MNGMNRLLAPLLPLLSAGLSLVLGASGCSTSRDKLPLSPIPLKYENGLLWATGHISPTQNETCDVTPEDDAPSGSGLPNLLLDVATPLTAFAPERKGFSRQFAHGQFDLRAASVPGENSLRFARCDIPVVRTEHTSAELKIVWKDSPLLLGGVIGGDQLSHYATELAFSQNGATAMFTRGDLAPACKVNRAVIPFAPLGGELAVRLEDTIIPVPATRVTVGVCVEPLSDPAPTQTPCLVPKAELAQVGTSLADEKLALEKQNSDDPAVLERIERVRAYVEIIDQIQTNACAASDKKLLGDLMEERSLRQTPFVVSGKNMRFLVSTAMPGLILTRTACLRLREKPTDCPLYGDDPAKDPQFVSFVLPGLNQEGDGDKPDKAFPIRLGGGIDRRAALAIVAKQKQLSPCEELARSRRQRYALPKLTEGNSAESTCLGAVCLRNLGRDPVQLVRRCGYSGLDPEQACDDQLSPIAAVVEIGGQDGDEIPAYVVADDAAVIRSANADLHNQAAQIDGILGVSVLERLSTTIDYPQGRIELLCNQLQPAGAPPRTCRAYRGMTYNAADSCAPNETLEVPSDLWVLPKK
jgi:hypothetical protein